MSSEKLYTEILEDFEKATNKNERIAVLRKYDHPRFRQFLVYALDDAIKFDVELPEKYRPATEPAGLNHAYLDTEVLKLYRFIKEHPKKPVNFTGKKQTQMFLVILEALHKDEAALLLRLVKKDLGVKFLTRKLVEEAFPGL